MESGSAPLPAQILAQVANPGLLRDGLEGLSRTPRTLPCKYFYDQEGSLLFEAITCQQEYYPTRTEAAIMRAHIGTMCEFIGPGAALIEYGSGSSVKTRLLLSCLQEPAAYVPLDISEEHLHQTADRLWRDFPSLQIKPVVADYTRPVTLPHLPARRRVVYFPGSTIGNFHPAEARAFLRRMADVAGPGGGLLIGVDLVKEKSVLEAAYNDTAGLTAAFNRNILRRLNDEADADFELDAWSHHAHFNTFQSRIEMHLVSECDQTVHLGGRAFHFRPKQTIWTESSYKYTVSAFAAMARGAGWTLQQTWTDPRKWFSVQAYSLAE